MIELHSSSRFEYPWGSVSWVPRHYHVFQQRWGEYVYMIQYMSGLKGYPADSRRRDVKVAAVAGWLIRENMFS